MEIGELCHAAGAQVYMDAANLNAILASRARRPRLRRLPLQPAQDVHDAARRRRRAPAPVRWDQGPPGAVPSGPVIVKGEDGYALDWKRQQSIGKLQAFWGNFGMHVRAYTYIRTMGAAGLRAVSENAVLNANYVMKRLEATTTWPPRPLHARCVLSARRQKRQGVSAMDVAKRLLDLGFYAPSTYFPMIVDEALMVEPTETESKETLDAFCEAMIRIAKEAEADPHTVHQAPVTTPVRRLDQTKAARAPNLRWRPRA